MATLLQQIAKLQFIDDKDTAITKDWPPIRKLKYQIFVSLLVAAIVAIAKSMGVEIPEEARAALAPYALELTIAAAGGMNLLVGYYTKSKLGETVNVPPPTDKPPTED